MKYFFLSLIFIPSLLKAEFVKPPCSRPLYIKVLFVSSQLKNPCGHFDEVERVFKKILSFSGTISPSILFLDAPAYPAQVSMSGVILLASRQKGWSEERDLKKSEVIWAHEIGHLIFNDWLKNSFPEIKPFATFMKEHDKFVISNSNPHEDYFSQAKNSWSQEAALVRDIQKPYSELFADVVAVFYKNDREALYKAYELKGMSAKARKERSQYSFKQITTLSNEDDKNIHFFFSPSRIDLAKKFMKFPLSASQKRSALKTIHEILVAEMKDLYREKKRPSDKVNLNKSLMKRIESSSWKK